MTANRQEAVEDFGIHVAATPPDVNTKFPFELNFSKEKVRDDPLRKVEPKR
jgi:hypothetical protein